MRKIRSWCDRNSPARLGVLLHRRRRARRRNRGFEARKLTMTINAKWSGLALGLAGAIAMASPSFAGPVLSNAAGLKAAASDHAIDVRWRRGWHGGGIAAGLAFGALAGAALGAATSPYYYGPGY